jgi:hypothetical protein
MTWATQLTTVSNYLQCEAPTKKMANKKTNLITLCCELEHLTKPTNLKTWANFFGWLRERKT